MRSFRVMYGMDFLLFIHRMRASSRIVSSTSAEGMAEGSPRSWLCKRSIKVHLNGHNRLSRRAALSPNHILAGMKGDKKSINEVLELPQHCETKSKSNKLEVDCI